jgi:galactokinase
LERSIENRLKIFMNNAQRASWFRAPGRVNLIGEHTDYTGGFVLPMATDLECVIGSKPVGGVVRITSLDLDEVVEVASDGSSDALTVSPDWGRLVAAVVASLDEVGRPPKGIEAAVKSSIPLGAGLSSSAAFEVACVLALLDAAAMKLSPVQVALVCQRAEQVAMGVPTGVMDQLVSIAAVEGAALLIDCESLETKPVPLPRGISIVAVHSGVERALGSTAYADRRRACEVAAARLGIPSLRHATIDQVADDPIARHVVSENSRVLEMVKAFEHDDREEMSQLLADGHASLRDDYQVSTPELDLLVELLVDAGAIGARLTGAGFGGSVVALTDESKTDEVLEAAVGRYRANTGLEARPFVLSAAAGAARLIGS